MSTKFFTNDQENTLIEKFAGMFKYNPELKNFDALVGYFRASGYFAIRPHLENVSKIRILVGIDVDRIVAKYHQGVLFDGASEEEAKEEVLAKLKEDVAKCRYDAEVEKGIQQFVEDVASGKIEIRCHPSRKLHAKIYIFRPDHWTQHKFASVITGSSNLTDAGLGVSKTSNYEFNVQLNDYDEVKFATDEFEALWKESSSIKLTVTDLHKALVQNTHLNDQTTPFELYVKTLISYFGQTVEYDPGSILVPAQYKKLSYQIDAVNQGFDKLCKYNGFFLADVVGLGKTVVTMMIAHKFLYSNGFPDHKSQILIISPPAVKISWERVVKDFGLTSNCRIITNGSIQKEEEHFGEYDLVIVDEAHRFRTNTAEGYKLLQTLCKSPAPRGGILGAEPNRKKVILVSATPLNNSPKDVQNLVGLFQDLNGSTNLDVPNLSAFFKPLVKRYDSAKKNKYEVAKPIIQKIYKEIRDNIVSPLTVRRTRTDLLKNDVYRIDLEKEGVVFPEVKPPIPLRYELNEGLDKLFEETLEVLADRLNYARYKVISYLKPDKRIKYGEKAASASLQLYSIMKTLLVKRLDSSFYAFKRSLRKFLDSARAMLQMLDKDCVIILPDVDVTDMVINEDFDKLTKFFEQRRESDENAVVFHEQDFESSFRTDLEEDRRILENLLIEWEKIDCDPKYDIFIKTLKADLRSSKNPSGKAIVFTESKDTSDYLKEMLNIDGFGRVLFVTASDRNEFEEIIAENFDANHSAENRRDDYDVLVSTEALAEGVNLHRAGMIINYDTPWNSIRLMQRVGRVNRIGSSNKFVSIYNFFPTAEVNSQIDLQGKARIKILSFHHALGTDNQTYSPDEETPESFELFNANYEAETQDEQLRLLLWLRSFRDSNPERYKIIEELPPKIRTGRTDARTNRSNLPSTTTIAFLKNDKQKLFFKATNDEKPVVISFLEAAKTLECSEDEKRLDAPEIHFKHVQAFRELFERRLAAGSAVGSSVVRNHHSPTEKNAIQRLKAALNSVKKNDESRQLIESTLDAVAKKRYNDLAGKIVAIFDVKQSLKEKLSRLEELVQNRLEKNPSEETRHGNEGKSDDREPEIVIAESLIGKDIQHQLF